MRPNLKPLLSIHYVQRTAENFLQISSHSIFAWFLNFMQNPGTACERSKVRGGFAQMGLSLSMNMTESYINGS